MCLFYQIYHLFGGRLYLVLNLFLDYSSSIIINPFQSPCFANFILYFTRKCFLSRMKKYCVFNLHLIHVLSILLSSIFPSSLLLTGLCIWTLKITVHLFLGNIANKLIFDVLLFFGLYHKYTFLL